MSIILSDNVQLRHLGTYWEQMRPSLPVKIPMISWVSNSALGKPFAMVVFSVLHIDLFIFWRYNDSVRFGSPESMADSPANDR